MKLKEISQSNKLEKIYFITLCTNVLLLNIFVGSTHNDPRTLTETIIILETLIFIIISKIKKKEKILIKGKIDIAVIAMVISTFIPLLFKTYCSLSYTIDLCVEYLTVYSMYILVRNLITTPKRKEIFLNVILLSSCIIIIFGIDRINFNVFQKFYDITRSSQVKDFRMTSTIGYWNATFAYIVSLMIIALGKYLNTENKKVSGIYGMYVCLAMYAFYFCNSRAGMVIFAAVFVAYLIKLKDINKAMQAILIIVIAYLFNIIFDKINTIYHTELTVIIGVLITLIATYILSYFIKKITNIKIKNAKRNALISMVILLIVTSAYIAIAKNYSSPIELKKWGDTITLYDLKNNSKYKIKVNLTQVSGEKLTIKVSQVDTKRKGENIFEQTYIAQNGKVEEEFEIEINQKNMTKVTIKFEGEDNSEWIFNKVYVNGKEDIVNYKYLPNSLMRLTKTLKFNNVSITERLSMYKSGFKLFLQHPIVGNGAKTFQNEYEKVREYAYSAMEVHSFYMDILIDYGIIGITACLSIIGITIYNFIKRKDKQNIVNISIFASWILVTIHTMFDFDLAYMVTLANFYIMIALINEEDKNIKFKTSIFEYIVILVLSICVATNIYKLPGEKLYRDGKYKEAMKYIPYYAKNLNGYITSKEDNVGLSQNLKKDVLIKYLTNEKNTYQYWNIISLYNISIDLIKNNNIDEGTQGIETILNLIENDEIIAKYDMYKKEMWQKFTENMKEDLQEINADINNSKIMEINERMKKI